MVLYMSFSVNVFSLFCNYLPLEKDGVLHLNKLEEENVKSLRQRDDKGEFRLENSAKRSYNAS